MYSGSHSVREREQEFAPLLFSLLPDGAAVTTPRTSTRTVHRDDSSMSAQRRSMNTPGSIHTETTPPTPPPPVLRLTDEMMEEPSTSRADRRALVPPPMHSLSSPMLADLDAMRQPYIEPAAPEHQDVWVTVYGFNQSNVAGILKEFSKHGDILKWGTFGQPQANFLHLQFPDKFAAQRALLRNGEQMSPTLIVGVRPVEARHRQAIEQHLAAGGAADRHVAISRKEVPMERSYRIEAQKHAVMPRPRSIASRVIEFVLGY